MIRTFPSTGDLRGIRLRRCAQVAALALAAAGLAGCAGLYGGENGSQRLAACAGTGTLFARLDVDQIITKYHRATGIVINAHIGQLKGDGEDACNGEDTLATYPPSTPLKNLARQLPPWQDPQRLNALSETDLTSVLLEHLRLYKCALLEKREGRIIDQIWTERTPSSAASASASSSKAYDFPTIWEEADFTRRKVDREVEISQVALERTIAFLGGIDRLHRPDNDLECIRRASLDLRNVLGLLAETLSCSTRIFDARGSLRDPAKPEE